MFVNEIVTRKVTCTSAFFLSDLITYIILDEDECSFEDWIANLEKEAEIALLRFVFDRIFSSSTPWASLVSGMIVMDIRWFSPKATTTYKTWGSDLCSVPRQSIFHSSFLLWWSFYACPLPLQSRGCSSTIGAIQKWRHPLKGEVVIYQNVILLHRLI